MPHMGMEPRRVRATFLVSAGKPYAQVWFRWVRSTDDMPDTMELVPEESPSPSGRTVYAALLRRMHAMHGREYEWGGIHIKARDEDGDLSFTVDGAASSALSEKQVDAARQVLLEAAFGIEPRFSEREIEDLLGSGYPTADVGKLDTAVPIERAAVAVYERFAAAVAKSRTEWAVPIDHPLLSAVELSWSNEPLGSLAAAKLVTTSAFAANRATFQSCLEKKLGPPQVKVTDYARGKKDYTFAVGDDALSITPSGLDFAPTKPGPFDPAAWSKVFAAIDACRETGEGSSLGAAKR